MYRYLDATIRLPVSAGRKSFYKQIADAQRSRPQRHIILCVTYDHLEAHVKLFPNIKSQLRFAQYTVFNPDWRYRLVFVDEAHRVRNPETRWSQAVTRVCAMAGYSMGATATPIYTLALDIVNIARALGCSAVADRSCLAQMLDHDPEPEGPETGSPTPSQAPTGAEDDEQIREAGGKYSYTDCHTWVITMAGHFKALASKRNKIQTDRKTPTMKSSNANANSTAEISELTAELGVDLSTESGQILQKRWDAYLESFRNLVIGPIRRHLQDFIVRCTSNSVDHLGRPITAVKQVSATIEWVKLTPQELIGDSPRGGFVSFAPINSKQILTDRYDHSEQPPNRHQIDTIKTDGAPTYPV